MSDALDPAAADRVLRRASELAGDDGFERLDGFDPEALVAAAAEVGIPERAVLRSLAIEALGPEPPVRRLDRLVGAGVVVEQRVVGAPPERVLERLDRWLVDGHHLRRERHRSDELEWARRDDVVGSVRRSVRGLSGEGRLGDVRSVRAAARPAGPGTAVVRVTIDRTGRRRTSIVAGSVLGGGGAAVGVAGLALTTPLAVAALPVLVAGGLTVSSSRSQADRFTRELLRVLDAVEAGHEPDGVLRGLRRRLTPRRTS